MAWLLMPQSVLAQGEPLEVITAEEFRIVDKKGKTRVQIDEDGLVILNANGDYRIGLDVLAGPHLSLADSTGSAHLGFTILKNDRTGSTEIRATGSMVLFDEEGEVVWSAP